MDSPYRRRRPGLIRNLWIYRNLVAVAFSMGILLWFVVINSTPLAVHFPFGLGTVNSTSGLLILVSALFGSLLTVAGLGVIALIRRLKSGASAAELDDGADLLDDRPPSDYAATTPEGFPDTKWRGGQEGRGT